MFRKIIRKLNNFRFTAVIACIISGIAALYSLGSIFLYHFAHDIDPEINVRQVGFSTMKAPTSQYLGMIFFFMAVLSLFISIYVAYSMVPFIKNKEKVSIRKGLLLAGFVGSIFQFALIALSLVMLLKDNPNTKVWIIVSLPFGVLSAIGSCLYLIPFIKCDFFMPAIKQQN